MLVPKISRENLEKYKRTDMDSLKESMLANDGKKEEWDPLSDLQPVMELLYYISKKKT